MKKLFIFFIFFPFFLGQAVFAYTSPGSPAGFVNDYAGLLSVEQKQILETKLVQFEKETTNEISIVTIKNLEGDTIENFAEELFKEWGIGKAKNDNGVLLLVALDDKKMRIEVGYGLEGALTDAQSYWIIQNVIRPAFQQNDYNAGIAQAADKIIAATQGEYVPSETQKSSAKINFKTIEVFAFLGFMAFTWLAAVLARSKSWWAGGVVGIIIGIVLIFIFTWIIGLIATLILTPLGLLFDYIISKAYQNRKSQGVKSFPWWMGGFGGGHGGKFLTPCDFLFW